MHTATPSYPKGNFMKTLIITSILAVSSFAALADSNNGETYGQTSLVLDSNLTRSEVVADTRQARSMGLIAFGEFSSPFRPDVDSAISPAEVSMELRTALHEGTIQYGDNENPRKYHH
jgi:hypothetical protein